MYFDGQGTQKLPCGKIPPGGVGGGGGYRLAHGLLILRAVFPWSVHLLLLTNSLIGQVIGTMHVTRVLFTCVSAYDV